MTFLFKGLLFLLIFKGLSYIFFPKWIQRFVAENIINTPLGRLKMFGYFQLILAIFLYSFIKRYFA